MISSHKSSSENFAMTVRNGMDREGVDLPIRPGQQSISDSALQSRKLILTAKPSAGSTHRAAELRRSMSHFK